MPPGFNVGLKNLGRLEEGRLFSKRMLPVEFIEWEYDGSDLLVGIIGTWKNFLGHNGNMVEQKPR